MEHLFGAELSRGPLLALAKLGQRGFVGHLAPEKGGHIVLLDLLQASRDAGAAEIFLRHDIGGDLAPGGRDFYVLLPENHRAIRIADFAGEPVEGNALIGRVTFGGKKTPDTHASFPLEPWSVPLDGQSNSGSESVDAVHVFRRSRRLFP